MVPLHVLDQTILFGPGIVAEVARVVPDFVVHGLDMLLKVGEVVEAVFALAALESFHLK